MKDHSSAAYIKALKLAIEKSGESQDAFRRADYPAALSLLDEAEEALKGYDKGGPFLDRMQSLREMIKIRQEI